MTSMDTMNNLEIVFWVFSGEAITSQAKLLHIK